MGNQQDAPIKCNLLLIGKTGTGKSSFANYLFGVDKFKVGPGAPVTSWEENFQQYSLSIYKQSHNESNGKSSKMSWFFHFFNKTSDKANTPVAQVNVYDSVGIEPNNLPQWRTKLDRFLSETQVKSTSSFSFNSQVPPANEIMHVCFYVINGASGRIEPNELSIIDKICQTHKLPVSVIITNCDVASESQLTAIEKEIKNKGLEAIRICSVSRKTRGGEIKEPFGKELAIKKVLTASYEKVGKELSIIAFKQLINFIRDLKTKIIKKIDDSDISIFKMDEMDSSFDKITEDLEKMLDKFSDFRDFLPSAYISYVDFIENFDVDYQGRDIFEDSFENFVNVLEDFDMENLSIARKVDKAMKDMEEGNVFQKMGAVLTMGGTALFIKSNIKNVLNEAFDEIVGRLNSQLLKIERS